MLSSLFIISFILFHFRGVSDVSEVYLMYQKCVVRGYSVVMPEFDVKMSDVFLYAVPMMIYCWNKCLNVRRGSTLSNLFTPCSCCPKHTRVRRTQLTRPSISGWYYPSVPGAQWMMPTTLCNTSGAQWGTQRHCFGWQGHIGRWDLLSENINSIEVIPTSTTTSAKEMSTHIPSWRCLFLCDHLVWKPRRH